MNDLFLWASKLFWLVAEPGSLLLSMLLLGTLLLFTPWLGAGRVLVLLAVCLLYTSDAADE